MSGTARRTTTAAGWRGGPRLARVTAPVRLLTPLGRGVLATTLLASALSARFHWQEFTQLAATGAGLLILGMIWQLLPGGLVVDLQLRHDRLVEGGPTPAVILEVQAGAAPMLFPRVLVPIGSSRVRVRLPFLAPFTRHTETLELPAVPRGVYVVGPVSYEKADPVALVSRRIDTGRAIELRVSPRVTDLSVFAGGLTNDMDGATSQQLSMSDLAFHALREYVPGDDLRHVHWRSSAKAGALLVRQYHETRRGHVTVLLDAAGQSYPRSADFELAVSVATSIALRAVRDDFDTYLRCGHRVVRGRSAVAMTDVASSFASGKDDHLEHAADAAGAVHGTGLVVQVTGTARRLEELDAAAQLFSREADWLVVRAHSAGAPMLRDSGALRELSVPDLDRLAELLARGMR